MPQIPLFVSSSQAEGAAQNGAFHVRFQPPLHVPEGAVDTTIHLAHATIPFTEPNVSAALGNNTIVVALPTADGSGRGLAAARCARELEKGVENAHPRAPRRRPAGARIRCDKFRRIRRAQSAGSRWGATESK
eukprot:COSAG06_NODE_702_length_12942_cov_22.841482_1_plen_133_part_00